MPIYKYQFCDGTTSEVEVSDEWFDVLTALDKQEENNNRRNTRRHISLDYLNTFDLDIEDKGSNPLEMLIRHEDKNRLDAALAQLLPAQRELIEKIFFGDVTAQEIADLEGVDKSAISHRLGRIYKKLEKLLR